MTASPQALLSPAAAAAADHGQLIEAIKLVRESQGIGLREAKAAVDAYLQGHPVQARAEHAAIRMPLEAVLALRHADKLAAIKLVRRTNGLHLKEAHDFVAGQIEANPELKALFAQKHKRSRRTLAICLIALAAALALVYFGKPLL